MAARTEPTTEMTERAETVNGVKVGRRPVCAGGKHQVAAYHGYCVNCGADGWTAAQRRETQRLQSAVPRG